MKHNTKNDQSLPWIIKYQPRTIDELILDDKLKTKLIEFYNEPEKLVSSLLLIGEPGTGKSSLSKIFHRRFVQLYGKQSVLVIKGSIDTSVDVIRSKIEPFSKSRSNLLKLVRIEEADYLSKNAQSALRNIISESGIYQNTRFILTANYSNKIIQPIKSRSFVITFDKELNFDLIKEKLLKILESENIEIPDEVDLDSFLNEIIKNHFPSIRDMITALEISSITGMLDPDITLSGSSATGELVNFIKEAEKLQKPLNVLYLKSLISKNINYNILIRSLVDFYMFSVNLPQAVDKITDLLKILENIENISNVDAAFLNFIFKHFKVGIAKQIYKFVK